MRSSRRRTFAAGMALLIGLSLGLGSEAQAGEAFEFALIGDYPYTPRDDAGMPFLMEDLRAAPSIEFVLHLGDTHSNLETDCGEAFFQDRREVLLGIGKPLILTPGDNDWADCGGDAEAQLEMFRRVFFSVPGRAGGPNGFPVRAQSGGKAFPELVENVLWEREGVLFATLHMIAPDPRKLFDPSKPTRARLIEAGEAWMAEVFRVAKERGARGVFLATQVSLWQISGQPHWLDLIYPELLTPYSAFIPFQEELIEHVRDFGGPVVMANGDSHYFRVDKPLFDKGLETIQTFTRVEGFGSPHGHWVRVRVDPNRPEVFSFRQELVEENLYTLTPAAERNDGYEVESFGSIRVVVRVAQTISKLLALVGGFVVLRGLWGVWRRSRSGPESA